MKEEARSPNRTDFEDAVCKSLWAAMPGKGTHLREFSPAKPPFELACQVAGKLLN